LCVESVAFINN